jgi:hypothetical protein
MASAPAMKRRGVCSSEAIVSSARPSLAGSPRTSSLFQVPARPALLAVAGAHLATDVSSFIESVPSRCALVPELDVQLRQADAQKGLDLVRPLMTTDGLVSAEQERDGLDSIHAGVDLPASVSPATAFNFGPLQEAIKAVDASGWKPA